MSTHWKAVFGVILVFVFGCLSGWLCASMAHYRETTRILQRDPNAVTELLERRLTGNLSLDQLQKEQVHDFLMENIRERRELQKQIQPQIQLTNQQTLKEIDAVLRPDQRDSFHENIIQFRKRFGQNPLNPNATNQPPRADSAPAPAATNDQPAGTNSAPDSAPAPSAPTTPSQ